MANYGPAGNIRGTYLENVQSKPIQGSLRAAETKSNITNGKQALSESGNSNAPAVLSMNTKPLMGLPAININIISLPFEYGPSNLYVNSNSV